VNTVKSLLVIFAHTSVYTGVDNKTSLMNGDHFVHFAVSLSTGELRLVRREARQ